MRVVKKITMDVVAVVRENAHLQDKDIAVLINRSVASVQDIRRRILGIRKPHGFKPGHTPVTKGKRIIHAGSFKKGYTPASKRPVGSIYLRKVGGKYRYWIVTAESQMYPYGRYLWEEHYQRRVPHGHVIAFKDSDPMNVDLQNLVLLTVAQNIARNHNAAKGNRTKKERRLAMASELQEYGITGKNNP